MPASRENFAGTGDSGDGLVCGGKTTLTSTFLYNGTAWSDGPSLNNGVQSHAAIGPTTNVIRLSGFAASGGRTTSTENYDGTSWSSYPATMGTGRDISVSAGGNATSGLVAGGNDGSSAVGTTEELNLSATVITGAAWSSGGSMGTARYKIASAIRGTQDAALAWGGRSAPSTATDLSEEYNGSTWSEGNNLNNATRGSGGAGTQTAGLRAGGFDGGPSEQNNAEEYDGTSWSNVTAMPLTRRLPGGAGIQTAALIFGSTGSSTDVTVEYDGTSWTAGGSLSTGRGYLAGYGLQTAAVASGGTPGVTNTEEYNGTAWTAGGGLVVATQGNAGGGNQTLGITFGGLSPSQTNRTQTYDGTSYVTSANMATARSALGGTSGASNTAGLAFGGSAPPQTTATEEFTGETSALNLKTLTTS